MTNKTVIMPLELAEFLHTHLCITCTVGALPKLDELRSLIAAPAVERQEPVAKPFAMFEVGEDGEHGVLITDRELLKELKGKRQHYFTHLYTSPPAPVAVLEMAALLRECKHEFCGDNTTLTERIDACLDKVKEMNK